MLLKIYFFFHPRLFKVDHAFLLSYNGGLAIWAVVSLTAAKFNLLMNGIFYVWLHLAHKHVHSRDFV
jgi:hypothetical protein